LLGLQLRAFFSINNVDTRVIQNTKKRRHVSIRGLPLHSNKYSYPVSGLGEQSMKYLPQNGCGRWQWLKRIPRRDETPYCSADGAGAW